MAIRRPRAVILLAAVLLALAVIGVYLASRRPGPGSGDGDSVAVLIWRRNVLAGEVVSPRDMRPVDLPVAVAADLPDVARAGEEAPLANMRLRRGVLRGDFVRRSSLEAAAPASRPVRGVEVDPGELTPLGDGRYVSTTRTAVAGMFDDAPVVIRPSADRAALPATSAPAGGLAESGLSRIDGKVDGAVLPAGARRLYAFRRKVPGGVADTAAYVVGLGRDDAENFYKTQLPRTGYKLISRGGTLRAGGVAMVFGRGPRHYCVVNLHPTDKDTETKVVLVISRPGT